MSVHLPSIGVAAYFLCTLLVTLRYSRRQETANSFLNATGNLPVWVATISFLAANCGALEIVGLSGIAARYGVQAFHFYWIGAIPAMIFVSFVMLPIYRHSGACSVPDYLGRRFGLRVRLLNAWSLLASTCLTAGVSLYALAEILHVYGGWRFTSCALVTASVVMTNVLIGGFRGTVRTAILHFFVMVAGLAPMLYLSVRLSGRNEEQWNTQGHLWRMTPLVSAHIPVDLIGVVFGLGVVISFSYWCTDFVLMQRALAARTAEGARRVPLYAGFGKLIFSFMGVLPVLVAGRSIGGNGSGALDQTSPMLMRMLYSPTYLSVGILALVASLMTGLGGNVSAFASLWTQEIYRSSLRPREPEQHYILIGRTASALCLALGLGAAYGTLYFGSLSEFMLVIFSITLVPFFAVVLLGITSRRRSAAGVLTGAISGIAAGGAAQIAYRANLLRAGSDLSANFHVALLSFLVALAGCFAGSLVFRDRRPAGGEIPVDDSIRSIAAPSRTQYALAALLLGCCVLLNVLWR